MEMKQLQYFVVSVDTGSISKAAEMLYTTQPHVSMTIGKMEKSLGVRLLRRSKKGVEMTVEGELVYEQARRILKDMQVIQQVQTSVKSEVFCLPPCQATFWPVCLRNFTGGNRTCRPDIWKVPWKWCCIR